MKLYVASKFENYREVREFCQVLRNLGHEITYDWTMTDEFDESGIPRLHVNSPISDPFSAREYARNDLHGVANAHALIVLWEPGMQGAHWESGMAALIGIPVLVIRPERYCIFYELPHVHTFADKGAALSYLHTLECRHADQSEDDEEAQARVWCEER